jgi:hypothetical protein
LKAGKKHPREELSLPYTRFQIFLNGKHFKENRIDLASQAAPNSHVGSDLIHHSPIPVPEAHLAFHPHARFRAAQSATALLALARR